MRVQNTWRHYYTITKYRHLVRRCCLRTGLYWQGLTHNLSKYSPEEFQAGVRYYQGSRSPNAAEREFVGYSRAWFRHKGRNKHCYEYWIDISGHKEDGLVENKMPPRYVAKMICDRIAACEAYKGKNYTSAAPPEYCEYTKRYITIHPETRALLEKLLIMLEEKGEGHTSVYLRKLLKKGTY